MKASIGSASFGKLDSNLAADHDPFNGPSEELVEPVVSPPPAQPVSIGSEDGNEEQPVVAPKPVQHFTFAPSPELEIGSASKSKEKAPETEVSVCGPYHSRPSLEDPSF